MAKTYSYAEIEKDLPLVVKTELAQYDDKFRKTFAADFSIKRKTASGAYSYGLMALHRWYLGNFTMSLVQALTIFCGIGVIWWAADFFMMPSLVRERNSVIAKTVLAEQKIAHGIVTTYQPMMPTMNITLTNTQ